VPVTEIVTNSLLLFDQFSYVGFWVPAVEFVVGFGWVAEAAAVVLYACWLFFGFEVLTGGTAMVVFHCASPSWAPSSFAM
jgi:hypothetical protein